MVGGQHVRAVPDQMDNIPRMKLPSTMSNRRKKMMRQ
jgi:hypothetical protein